MNMYTLSGLQNFAAAYGDGSYGICTYSSSGSADCSTAGGSTNSLVNTGVAVGLVVGVACLALVVAILVRFWRRPAKKLAEEVVTDETHTADDPQDDGQNQPSA